MTTKELQMAHDKAWRDSGVEIGRAGDPRRIASELKRIFLSKGHDSVIFAQCKCSKKTH